MLTNREQMIFNWIKEQPSITQKEIAERAGISRSSVSVHISNLTAKGAILGRRYILSERPYFIVIGAANMDIAGRPNASLVAGDSNPGKVTMSFGGVGRNVAHNLALLDSDVRLLTAFGEDYRARELKEGCLDCGIDIDASITVPGASTSTYLFIMDEHGEMQEAINDMQIYEHVTPERIEERLDVIQHAAACVIDTNLTQQTIEFIARNVTCPIFCDPVSSIKAQKLKRVLAGVTRSSQIALKPRCFLASRLLTTLPLKKLLRHYLQRDLNACSSPSARRVFFVLITRRPSACHCFLQSWLT